MIDGIKTTPPAVPIHPPHSEQKLTEAQQETIKAILSQYDPDSIAVEDAKAMNEAFREAGIKRGPGLRDAIKSVGFDPGEISRLYPSPKQNGPKPMLCDENNGINKETLQKLYAILSDYDLAEMAGDKEAELIQRLFDEGLIERASIVDNFT